MAAKPSGASHEGSFVDRMMHSGKTMVVFYGSQTGTAEDFAQRIAKQAKRYGISAAVCDPEECDMVCLCRLALRRTRSPVVIVVGRVTTVDQHGQTLGGVLLGHVRRR